MKKIALLFTILCAGALYGMKRIQSRSKYGHYVSMAELSPEIQVMIIQALNTYDKNLNPEENLVNIINAIKAMSATNRQFNTIVNDIYGNLAGFTALVHILGKKFNINTDVIATKFETPIAEKYIQLGQNLMKETVQLDPINKVVQLIEQGADVNYSTKGYTVTRPIFSLANEANYYDAYTPLYWAVRFSRHALVKLLLNAGAIPKSNDYYEWPRDNNSADAMKQLLEEARGKEAL